ncbi:MAG: hypothetical protein M1817_000546 [Caeruleum heppii]|nr:MAG: hypothetical protein M1817_000546 [Caeruleum heppii]
MRQHTKTVALYCGLEDSPPSPLRQFIALPPCTISVLGSRRTPPVPCPGANTDRGISILTSVGFRKLDNEDYVEAVQMLQPDIVLGMGDVIMHRLGSAKRTEKMGDRTTAWTKDLIDGLDIEEHEEASKRRSKPAIFAPILPLEPAEQSIYISDLVDTYLPSISGLTIYDPIILSDLPASLRPLPVLSLANLATPHDILSVLSYGVDLFTVPFLHAITDAGIAFDISFPAPAPFISPPTAAEDELPLGINLWAASHATSLDPLRAHCECYTCTHHHRAYVHHLLDAKEMLGWVLLQVHNLRVLDDMFDEIRRSIERGTFEEDRQTFHRTYRREFPEQTGAGPRIRGYQFAATGPSQPKKNRKAYGTLDENAEKVAEAKEANLDADLGSLSVGGEADGAKDDGGRGMESGELERKGFAERTD